MIREQFVHVIENMSGDADKAKLLWAELEKRYNSPKRYYHTEAHLNAMLNELMPVKEKIVNWNQMILAIAYHDSVYDPLRRDNEEQSASLAEKRLTGFCDISLVRKIRDMIHLTKSHIHDEADDMGYLIDADLAIFGADPITYEKYTEAIRKEYSIYPDNIYNAARKNVLLKFLQNSRFYITPHFFKLYEEKARKNVSQEILSLG